MKSEAQSPETLVEQVVSFVSRLHVHACTRSKCDGDELAGNNLEALAYLNLYDNVQPVRSGSGKLP